MIRIFIVDDHPVVTEGIKSLLIGDSESVCVGEAYTAKDCLSFLSQNKVDVILLDINLPDISGVDLCAIIKKQYPDILILSLTTLNQASYITKILDNGASGYVLKNAGKEELLHAIKIATAGGTYMSIDAARILENRSVKEPPKLTRREKEVLALISEGLTTPEMAERLFVSAWTIESHRKSLLAKLNVKNTASLIKFALENGLI